MSDATGGAPSPPQTPGTPQTPKTPLPPGLGLGSGGTGSDGGRGYDDPFDAGLPIVEGPRIAAPRVGGPNPPGVAGADDEGGRGTRAVVLDSGVPSLADPETDDLPAARQRRRLRKVDDGRDEDGNLRPIVVATPLAPGFRGVIHPRWVQRLFTTHDIYGPRVRFGVLWFAVQAFAVWRGADALALLYGVIGVVAALQTTREWRRHYSQPSRLVAAVGAGILPFSATFGIGAVGLVVFGIVIASVAFALFRRRHRWSRPLLDAASCTVRSSVFVGVAGASVVLTYKASLAGVLILLGLIAAYEVGDFLIGAESAGVLIGPMGGMLTAAVFTAPIAVFNISPFEQLADYVVFGGIIVVFCPLSQIAGSLILPSARAWSPALRRVDSLLLTAPVWLLLLWSYLG